uniref:Citron Rho-interacting kinase-like n=1 Tax=Phallusia mammillata TaxID=59560 RepID=A0A6F9D8Q2_9ASCI|nr:citron Rho-interacting kinase-like [Phallusia mammillata]
MSGAKILQTKKDKTVTLSPAFSQGKSSTLKDVESEYIKNLQQQIYFLELEAEYLREQAKKATDIQPKITKEADRMMYKLKDMQSDMDGMKLEISRKDANISMLGNEKLRLSGELNATEDNYRREKQLLTEEVIQLKKMREVADRDISLKDSEIVSLRQELERTAAELRHEKHAHNLLNAQFNQRVGQHEQTHSLLEEKRAECLRKQSEMHLLEEKFNTSTMAIHDKITRELTDEIRSLRQQLRSTELTANQERILKDKLSGDVSKLSLENASLQTRVLDLTKQLDREWLIRDEKDSRAMTHSSKITELKGTEQVLQLEVKKMREMLESERRKFHELESLMLKAQDGMSSSKFHNRTLQSKYEELDMRFVRCNDDNAQLRKDKQILVEHVSQLQKKLDLKEAEIQRLESHMYTLQQDVSGLRKEIDKSKTLQSQHWDKVSRAAESLRISS